MQRKYLKRTIRSGTVRKRSGDRLAERAMRIKLILMDNDGVLTNGSLFYGHDGIELVRYDVKDGLGIKLAQGAGLLTGIISGLESKSLKKRAEVLELDEIHTNVSKKLETYEKIKKKRNLEDEQVAFIGDDVIDIPIMIRCGLSVAVADAHPEVRKIAHLVTRCNGGQGAVREFIDYLLKTQDHWKSVIQRYYS